MLDICFEPSLGGMLILNRFNSKLGEPVPDVITLGLYMDVGDLTSGVFSEKRKKSVAGLFKDPWLAKRSFIDKRHWDAMTNCLAMIRKRASDGEHIRIWYGPDADSYSSFLWLVSELQDCNANMTAVSFSDLAYELEPYCYNWAQINPEDLSLFAQFEHAVTRKQQANISLRWKGICASSLPLRIVLNGHIVSVSEDYFDRIILDSLPEASFTSGYVMREFTDYISTNLPYSFIRRRMCDLFRKHCEIIGEKESTQEYLLDRLVFQKNATAI